MMGKRGVKEGGGEGDREERNRKKGKRKGGDMKKKRGKDCT